MKKLSYLISYMYYFTKNHPLYKWIKENNLSVIQFCKIIGISKSSFYRYLDINCNTCPSIEVVKKITTLIKCVTLNDFIKNKIDDEQEALEYIKNQLKIFNIKQKQLAWELKLTTPTINRKLKREGFSKEEIYKIIVYLNKITKHNKTEKSEKK